MYGKKEGKWIQTKKKVPCSHLVVSSCSDSKHWTLNDLFDLRNVDLEMTDSLWGHYLLSRHWNVLAAAAIHLLDFTAKASNQPNLWLAGCVGCGSKIRPQRQIFTNMLVSGVRIVLICSIQYALILKDKESNLQKRRSVYYRLLQKAEARQMSVCLPNIKIAHEPQDKL